MGPAGCCATPPGIEWSDAGRIVSRGGRDFLLSEIAAGRLRPGPRGLFILRVEPADRSQPRRCAYHGPRGCTIPPDRRAATCNYYVCEDALREGPDAGEPRRVMERLVAFYAGLDRTIAARVAERWPGGAPWDEEFLDWLGSELVSACGGGLGVSPIVTAEI
jgi:hypothetical protein